MVVTFSVWLTGETRTPRPNGISIFVNPRRKRNSVTALTRKTKVAERSL